MGYVNLSYCIGKSPKKVLSPKNLWGPVRKPMKSDQRKIWVPQNQDFSTFSSIFPPNSNSSDSKMIMNHLDIVLSFHLQRKLGGLAQKWASYGDFCAATWIFLKYAFRPDQPLGWNFELGLTAPIFGRSAQFFFCWPHIHHNFSGESILGPFGPHKPRT